VGWRGYVEGGGGKGFAGGQWWCGRGEKSDKQDTTKVVSCLATHRLGLPLVGSPLAVSLPEPSVEQGRNGPHPSGEGRSTCGWMATVGASLDDGW